jgi:glycosyltransferase involved in cell wall biosynthesis
MRILYVVFHNYADLPYHAREWVEAASALGHEVTVLTSVDPEFLRKIGWGGGIADARDGVLADNVGARSCGRMLRIHQVPFPHSIPTPWRYLVLERRFRRELARLIGEDRPDVVYERFSLISSAGSSLARRHGIPYGVELNGILDRELPGGWRNGIKRRIHQGLERGIFARSDAIIAVTNQIRDWVVADYRVPPERVVVIPNGVSPERFSLHDQGAARRKFGVPEDAFVVGFLGSLFPWQNLPVLVDIAPRLAGAIPGFFCMIGGGQEPILSQLRNMVRERGLADCFLLPGQIPWDDAADFISCFDAAVAPIWRKGDYAFSPLKLAAYMACERVVIATDAPGIRELLEQSGTGHFFAFQDSDDLARVVEMVAQMSVGERAACGRRGREYILQHLSWRSLVAKTLDFMVNKGGAA